MPLRCCSGVNETSKSKLKSFPNDDAQENVHPIRLLYSFNCASGARDTARSITSMIGQMNCDAVEAIRDRRAGRTPRFVVGPEHEMIDEELRASSEEISEGRFSFVGLEAVLLVDSNPRQFLPPPRRLAPAA